MAHAPHAGKTRVVAILAMMALLAGCRAMRPASITDVLSADELAAVVQPSNLRNWTPNQAVLPTADWDGRFLTVHNIRNTKYLGPDDYIVRHYDKTFDLDKLDSVDFIVVPFKETPSLAHTMLSFGFGEDGYLAVSVEVRREQGETYSPVKGSMRQYEIMYVAADERDVILLRTKYRKDEVYLYRTKATRQQARALLLDVVARMNKLAVQPEFYDTFANNCTTNIVNHINRIHPGRIPPNLGVLLPGYADRLAYDLGLLDTTLTFEQTKRRARITRLANRYADDPEFSVKIRQR